MAKASGGTRNYRSSPGEEASRQLRVMLDELSAQGFSKMPPIKVGGLERRMRVDAASRNIELGSDMYMTTKQVFHSQRPVKKEAGISVEPEKLIRFPIDRFRMKLYYNNEDKNYIYFDGGNKYVVQPNRQIKLQNGKIKAVNFITASKVDGTEFGMQKYEEVKKK